MTPWEAELVIDELNRQLKAEMDSMKHKNQSSFNIHGGAGDET